MSDIVDLLKAKNGYTEERMQCGECKFFKEDDSTDNFGPGDLCVRNADVCFCVRCTARCDKFERKGKNTLACS